MCVLSGPISSTMFTCRRFHVRRKRMMCLYCSRRWRCRTTKTTVIVLILISLLMFQLLIVFSSSSLMSLSSLEDYRHVYVQPVCQAQTRFVYTKMIKCASSTLSAVFRRFGLLRNLSFVLPPKGRIYVGWPYQVDDSLYRPCKSSSGFDIFCEHAIYNRSTFTELMGKDTVYITSIREPFSQVKSMVNYYNVLNISDVPMLASGRFIEFLSDIEKYEAVYKSANASRERFCIPDGFSMTRNLMSFNLGFPTGGFRSVDDDLATDGDLVQHWIAELDSDFSLVLIVEHFYESMVLLRRQMCWSLEDILFVASNAGSYDYRAEESAVLVTLYRRRSSVDYQLYQHFNNSLWRKIAAQVACIYN